MNKFWWTQMQAVIRLEIRKTFLSRRSLWVYLLALAPVALFLLQSLVEMHQQNRRMQMAHQGSRVLSEADLTAIHEGMTHDEVMSALGNPADSDTFEMRTGPQETDVVPMQMLRYSDGREEFVITLKRGVVSSIRRNSGIDFALDSRIFATVFQFFFLRLAVFFGCLGIFMNLFRGEMLDKTLHFYLLAPMKREVLLVGKYLAGLLAAIVIFTCSTALQIVTLLWHFDNAAISQFLYQNHGLSEIAAYLGVTVLACIGYGSIFLAAGLLFRNPIIPAVFVLVWEAANPILPSLLKKFSVIYYLKSLCPVDIPLDPGMPPLLAVLVSNAEPVSRYLAVFGLLALSIAVLAASMPRVRRLEINYTSE